ncbi:Glyoxalase/bleomycin resistance protein/dioxygenase [Gloeocapsa sp. PCC 7428]|uniref:VOC family protein n=1 Tax=Gloeocapsa sp. PCC 7428 TaxID=1173026 RepID=UPI0002A5EA83|nr:VOC family protein [Gloeocapsa sp. PCC 7428]AFZ31556.1 Glyoxalase/bleomycin resistance protein/dioxygenase [Gloeocapsa sp. PCC 7428]
MKFGYTIFYVPDVSAAVSFYEQAFGLSRRFVHESSQYAEMETGSTILAFASEEMAKSNGLTITPHRLENNAAAVEVAFITETIEEAFNQAIKAGAVAVKPIEVKPWGQTVGYVRDLNGVVVELCTPVL